jgi:ketosteroid isomerase-like protein
MRASSLEDRLSIGDLLVRYTTSLDEGDIEGVVSCFTEDGVVDSPITERFEGRERIRFFASRIASYRRDHGAQLRHFISDLQIEVDGDRARATCYLLDFLTIGGKTELLSPGQYDCRLIRAGGEWLIESRLVHMDRHFRMPWSPAKRETRPA